MELPEPFQLPEKFVKEFCAYKYQNEGMINDLLKLREHCDRVIQNDVNLKKKQLEKWWNKVEKELKKHYSDEQINSICGLEVDEDRNQIIFLSERDIFALQIDGLPKNMQTILLNSVGKQMSNPIPSSKQLNQIVDDFLHTLFKK